MTVVGAGGVVIKRLRPSRRFKRDFRKLDNKLQERVRDKLNDLLKNPRPPGLGFEKLAGHSKPEKYTIHVTGNYKISMEIDGNTATLRRVGNHDEIDRAP